MEDEISQETQLFTQVFQLDISFLIGRKHHELQTGRNVYSVLIMSVSQWLRSPNESIVLE